MRISLEDYLYSPEDLTDVALSLEALSVHDAEKYVYVLLTDTKTLFSKVAKHITGDPYNHVSLMLDYDFDNMYTFNIKNGLNRSGGFMREDRLDLKGSRYSLYRVAVDTDTHARIKTRVADYLRDVRTTTYNHLGIINAIAGRGVFKDSDKSMICSQFVASLLDEVGVSLFKDRAFSTLRPYEFVRSKLLKFVERGTIR